MFTFFVPDSFTIEFVSSSEKFYIFYIITTKKGWYNVVV